MGGLRSLIECIVNELTTLKTTPRPYPDKVELPRMIDAGNGSSLIVSREIDKLIEAAADQWFNADPTLHQRYKRREWRAVVRRAFGPALGRIDPDKEPAENAEAVRADVKQALNNYKASVGVREFAFGCTLFSNDGTIDFAVGPVRFESRLDWLERKRQEGDVSATSHRRIERAWSGSRLRKRRGHSYDGLREADIVQVIGSCPFVCSVKTNGLGYEAGLERSLTVARMATAAIALLWQEPSKALDGLNLLFDRSPRLQKALSFIPGKVVLAGSAWSHSPHGPWLKADEWAETMAQSKDYFGAVAEVLDYVVNSSDTVTRPKMMNTLAQALLWFHEACRETVTLMAIVKFAACLDALADGKESAGILKLINTRLGIPNSQVLRKDGPTLKEAVKKIYGDARSRTIHGTNDRLDHDWSDTRGLAEWFGGHCLLACIEWTAKNPSVDDPSQFSQA